VLQGFARHADHGLMKKRWSEDDIQQMAVKPLEFTDSRPPTDEDGYDSL
jgi:hypothetical protein